SFPAVGGADTAAVDAADFSRPGHAAGSLVGQYVLHPVWLLCRLVAAWAPGLATAADTDPGRRRAYRDGRRLCPGARSAGLGNRTRHALDLPRARAGAARPGALE